MSMRNFIVAASLLFASASLAQGAKTTDSGAAFEAAFGARQSVTRLALSPDGKSVAYIGPTAGLGSGLFTIDLTKGVKAQLALVASHLGLSRPLP